jgi:hypothetical protein
MEVYLGEKGADVNGSGGEIPSAKADPTSVSVGRYHRSRSAATVVAP